MHELWSLCVPHYGAFDFVSGLGCISFDLKLYFTEETDKSYTNGVRLLEDLNFKYRCLVFKNAFNIWTPTQRHTYILHD